MDLLRKTSLCRVTLKTALVVLSLFALMAECRPYYRWYDYDHIAKPIQDTGSGQILGVVGPLRPYEPWVLDCNLLFHEKTETGKRHPRCKEVDEENEKEYAKFLLHVQQWEGAYPDRAERWNVRFPEAKESEKKKYEQLKLFADSHKTNLEFANGFSTTSLSPRPTDCPNGADSANCGKTTGSVATSESSDSPRKDEDRTASEEITDQNDEDSQQ